MGSAASSPVMNWRRYVTLGVHTVAIDFAQPIRAHIGVDSNNETDSITKHRNTKSCSVVLRESVTSPNHQPPPFWYGIHLSNNLGNNPMEPPKKPLSEPQNYMVLLWRVHYVSFTVCRTVDFTQNTSHRSCSCAPASMVAMESKQTACCSISPCGERNAQTSSSVRLSRCMKARDSG